MAHPVHNLGLHGHLCSPFGVAWPPLSCMATPVDHLGLSGPPRVAWPPLLTIWGCTAGYNSASETKRHDADAIRYLSYVLYPVLACYAGWSLLYKTHRSWYSFVLNTFVGAVYTFGFILMCPQVSQPCMPVPLHALHAGPPCFQHVCHQYVLSASLSRHFVFYAAAVWGFCLPLILCMFWMIDRLHAWTHNLAAMCVVFPACMACISG